MLLSRRRILQSAFAGATGLAATPLIARAGALTTPASREIAFYHLHTGERVTAAYYDGGKYVPDALAALNHVLRDWRSNDVHDIDPGVFDQLHALQARVETPGAFNVICGYRSPATNEMLHEKSEGVAKHSLHMEGKAMDISLPGKDLAHLHEAALSLKAGGVGYYPASNFIHMDTGAVRRWG